MCREFGCLPGDIENLTAHEFMELAAYLKVCDDAERKAYEDSRRKAELESKLKPRRR